MSEKTTTVHIVMSRDCTGHNIPRLFGGQLMDWIDTIGAVAARRYARTEVTTACIENLSFLSAAYLNDMVVQEAVVTWTGRTSMEVRVDSFVESLDGSRKLINRSYMVFVALDENNVPTPVPQFVPITEEEKLEYEAAIERRNHRMSTR